MGGYADRRSVHYGTVFHYDNDRIRQIFQAVSLHGDCAGSSLRFCGRTLAECGKELYQILRRCLEGAIIVLACIVFSLFASAPPVVDPNAAAVSMVWSYIGELVFNMLVLVGAVKMADRVVREMMGL